MDTLKEAVRGVKEKAEEAYEKVKQVAGVPDTRKNEARTDEGTTSEAVKGEKEKPADEHEGAKEKKHDQDKTLDTANDQNKMTAEERKRAREKERLEVGRHKTEEEIAEETFEMMKEAADEFDPPKVTDTEGMASDEAKKLKGQAAEERSRKKEQIAGENKESETAMNVKEDQADSHEIAKEKKGAVDEDISSETAKNVNEEKAADTHERAEKREIADEEDKISESTMKVNDEKADSREISKEKKTTPKIATDSKEHAGETSEGNEKKGEHARGQLPSEGAKEVNKSAVEADEGTQEKGLETYHNKIPASEGYRHENMEEIVGAGETPENSRKIECKPHHDEAAE